MASAPAGRRLLHVGKLESIHVQRWAAALAVRGWDVHVATYGRIPPDLPPPGARSITIHRLTQASIPGVSFAWRVAQLRRILRRVRPDLVHAHSIAAYGTYAAAAVPRDVPLVVTSWGYSHLLAGGAKRRLDEKCVARADAVTTLVDDMRDWLVEEYGLPAEKVHHIPWGVDPELFRPGYAKEADAIRRRLDIPEGAPVVLSNRNMDPYYNIDTILRAAEAVLSRGGDAWFLLRRGYGTAVHEAKMRRLAAGLGIAHRVVFDDALLPYEEVPAVLNLAQVSVMVPATDQGPASLHEAMACGTFPIATDLPGNREWITPGENGFLVESDDPVALADAIETALGDPKLRERAAAENRKRIAERGDWRVNVARMEALYAALIKRDPLARPDGRERA